MSTVLEGIRLFSNNCPDFHLWEWEACEGVWHPYNPALFKELEALRVVARNKKKVALTDPQTNTRGATFAFVFIGAVQYLLDVEAMTQTRMDTNTKRRIRRTRIAGTYRLSASQDTSEGSYFDVDRNTCATIEYHRREAASTKVFDIRMRHRHIPVSGQDGATCPSTTVKLRIDLNVNSWVILTSSTTGSHSTSDTSQSNGEVLPSPPFFQEGAHGKITRILPPPPRLPQLRRDRHAMYVPSQFMNKENNVEPSLPPFPTPTNGESKGLVDWRYLPELSEELEWTRKAPFPFLGIDWTAESAAQWPLLYCLGYGRLAYQARSSDGDGADAAKKEVIEKGIVIVRSATNNEVQSPKSVSSASTTAAARSSEKTACLPVSTSPSGLMQDKEEDRKEMEDMALDDAHIGCSVNEECDIWMNEGDDSPRDSVPDDEGRRLPTTPAASSPEQMVGSSPSDAATVAPEDCRICSEQLTEESISCSQCNFTYCVDCFDSWMKPKNQSTRPSIQCPQCKLPLADAKGSQPSGWLEWWILPPTFLTVPGYERHPTLLLNYDFPDGEQLLQHLNPGAPFRGDQRVGFFPYIPETAGLLPLFLRCFMNGRSFTVGESLTTGEQNTLIWGGVHHKTSLQRNAAHGYPDTEYFRRVEEELRAQHIHPQSDDERRLLQGVASPVGRWYYGASADAIRQEKERLWALKRKSEEGNRSGGEKRVHATESRASEITMDSMSLPPSPSPSTPVDEDTEQQAPSLRRY